VNPDHFKKVGEAYSTLKNPKKRQEYDSKRKIRSKSTESKSQGSSGIPNEHRRKRTVREEQDPEIEEAFKKLNLDKLFGEFDARPMRNKPEDLNEHLM